MLKKIKPQRITEIIVGQIKDAILNGDFKAGQRLPAEREMAEQMEISRSSLREALNVLAHSGLVEVVQGRGTFVKEVGQESLTDPLSALILGSESRYHEVYEFRTAIEVWAAGRAAERIEQSEIESMQKLIDQMQILVDRQEPITELDAEFHLAIAKASHNSIYYHVSNTVFHIISEVTRLSHENLFLTPEDQQLLCNDHVAIFNAMANHDTSKAEELMRRHLLRVDERLPDTQSTR